MKKSLFLLFSFFYTQFLFAQTNVTVYVGSDDGKLYAIDAQTGLKKWEFVSGSKINSSPTVANGVVYVGSWDSKLYAIDAQTGMKKWEFLTGYVIWNSSPVIGNGIVYIGSYDNKLYAIDAQTGLKKWEFVTGSAIYSSPTLVNGIVYIGSQDQKLYAIDAQTGVKKWEFATQSRIMSSPLVVNGVVYVANDHSNTPLIDDKLYAIDAQSGAKKWEFILGDYYDGSSPTIVNQFLYIVCSSKVYSIDIQSGIKKWESVLNYNGTVSSPIVSNETVYFGSWNKLFAINSITGLQKWESLNGSVMQSSPTVANGTLFVGSDDNKFYALDGLTGTKKWEFVTGGDVRSSPCVVDSDGKVYHSSVSGYDDIVSCPTCITGQSQSSFSTQDHFCATQTLCNQTIINKAQPDPKQKIIRGDLAKIAYLGLVGRSAVTNAEKFDNPFIDLQNVFSTDTTYYKFAKTLSYLQYQDGLSPFDRNRTYFYPSDTITRATVLKVFLEAWNIDENAISGTSPFTDVASTHSFYKYIKKAHELGIITGSGGLFKPDVGCTREDAFLMLYRMMTSASITKPTLTQINAGFFVPNTFRPDNLGVGIGNDRGNFNHYTKTSFAIDGTVPLVFAHSYNSYTTELPDSLFNNPLGRGWTHSFNCYVLAYGESTDPNRRRIVHYPDGTLHYYKENSSGTWVPESIGVFDTMVQGSGFIEITTPSKVVYRFETQAGKAGKYMLIKSIKDRNNNTLTFTNELGDGLYPRLKSVAAPAGRTLNFLYKTSTNWLTEVNLSGVGVFNGRKIAFDYHIPIDGDGYADLKEYKEPDLNGTLKTTTYGYFTYTDSTAHLLKTITLPKGNIIDNTYQQRKLTSSRTMNGANVVQKMDVNLTPNYTGTVSSSSSVVKTTDENGLQKTTNYNHNTNGLPTQVTTTGTQPLNLGMTYGTANDPTAVTRLTQNGTGVRIQYYSTPPYNVQLIKTAKAAGDSITQSFTYNGFNDVLTSTNGRGFTTTFGYNGTGNLTSITDPRGKNTLISRRTDGLVNTVTTPTGIQTTFGYNTYGNLTSTSVANGANPPIATSALYDALSRLTTTIDPRSKQTTYEYYANDLLKKTTAPMSVATNYNYDANDNLTTITNAKGFATTMSYNTQTDQLMSRSFGGKTESFTYYNDGALKTYTNKRNDVFTFTYDASGRVKSDSYATYDYNLDGTLNTISNTSNGRINVLDYDYDLLKRISKTTLDNKAVQYAYDNNNNLTTLTYPDGKTVNYTYDNNDRLTTVIENWSGTNRTTTYNYDDDGKLLNYTLPNGMKCIYTYDAAGRMTGMRNEKTGAVVLNSYTYVLDAAGNHLEENIVEPYSAAVSLTAGTTNYTTDNANLQTQAGSSTYGFDNNGAITTQAGQTLTYDTRDNLLTGYGNTYYYDGNETRRAKTGKRYIINELTNSVIAETDDAGTYQYYYVYGPTGLLYRQSAGGTTEFYHYDFRGSTIATTNATQTVVRQYQYDAFGKILQQTPTTDDNPFRYVGQHGVQYENANLYFMRARYYDPNTGRFVSEDPIWATNLYPYAGNNPITWNDPLGKDYVNGEENVWAWTKNAAQTTMNTLNNTAKGFFMYSTATKNMTYKFSDAELKQAFKNLSKPSLNENKKVMLSDGSWGYAITQTASNEQAAFLGDFTVFYDLKGNPVGLYDELDYNHKELQSWMNEEKVKETKDRNILCAVVRAVTFPIKAASLGTLVNTVRIIGGIQRAPIGGGGGGGSWK